MCLSCWLVFLGWGLGVTIDANVDVHLCVPEGRGNVYGFAFAELIRISVGIPLHSSNLRIIKIIVIPFFYDPSTILIHVISKFLNRMFICFAHVGWSFLVGLVVEIDCHTLAKVAIYFWCDWATNY